VLATIQVLFFPTVRAVQRTSTFFMLNVRM